MENLKFAITEECPQIPAQNASRNVHDAYEKWMKANEKSKAYILASLFEVLAKKHETMVTAREIMDSLREMFEQPSSQLKHDALKFIFNAYVKEGTSIENMFST